MKYFKKLFTFLAIAAFVLILYTVISNNSAHSYLFFFPILSLSFFLGYYLYKQSEKDDDERIKKQFKNVAEDVKAEKWVKESFAPDTLTIIKLNRWIIIIYSFLFLLIVTFLWGYLTNGFLHSLRDFAYIGILFWSFIMYTLTAPYLFELLEKPLPKKLREFFENDWVRGYIFLFPISFYLYLLFPYESIFTELQSKFATLPLFFLIYTSIFMGSFSITYLYEDIQEEEKKRLKKEVIQSLEKNKK